MDTPDDAIIYTVTRPLREGEGSLEHIDAPFRSTAHFTQADINNNRIVYRPPLSDVGTDEKEFSFFFTGNLSNPTSCRSNTTCLIWHLMGLNFRSGYTECCNIQCTVQSNGTKISGCVNIPQFCDRFVAVIDVHIHLVLSITYIYLL